MARSQTLFNNLLIDMENVYGDDPNLKASEQIYARYP